MPLLDHFRPPLSQLHSWESFHSNWATRLADLLNERLPMNFRVEERTDFPRKFEVRTYITGNQLTPIGVIGLITPFNKETPFERLAFATKAANYLRRGVSFVLVDIVTSRSGNLHSALLDQLECYYPPSRFPDEVTLYSSPFHSRRPEKSQQCSMGLEPLAFRSPLPTMPLRRTGVLFVPVDLEASYTEACLRRRIAG